MWRLFKFLGFVFSWVCPFVVLYINHVVLVETSQELDMFGLIVALIIVVSLVKWVDKRTDVWDIQDKNKLFILSWGNAKKILMALALTWVAFTIEDNLVKMQWTATLISISLIVGYVFSLIGELTKKKEKSISKT